VTTRDLRDDPRDVDEGVERVPLPNPLECLPAWWGPVVDDSDQQRLGGVCDLTKYVPELGQPLLVFAKSSPRRHRFLVCEELKLSDWAGVYVAIDCCADRTVVLKISHHTIDREARLAVRASHPNVITVFEAVVYRGYPTMVMEWCPQGTLDNYARLGADWRQVLLRGIEAGRGLAHFHAQGKVHGDVKPINILVADDVGKLADFGIARSATEEGDAAGTWTWAPPERFFGDWKPPGDVYSYAKTLVSVLKEVEGVPEQVWTLLKAAKAVEPEQRPTMVALLADLEQVLDREPRASGPAVSEQAPDREPPASGRLRNRRRRFHWQAVAIAAGAAVVTSTVVLAAVCSLPDEGQQSTTRWAIEVTLELAAESVENGDGESAVQYLSLAYSRARRDFDRYGERSVAEQGMQLARRLAELGDIVNARECLSVAHLVFHDQQDHRGMQRVTAIERELNRLAATRSPHRSR
jgi:hypothetical protein